MSYDELHTGDLDRAATALCDWLLESVGEAHDELCDLHPETWKEVAEVAMRRAGRHEFEIKEQA